MICRKILCLLVVSENVLQLTSLPSEKNTKALWIALKRRIMNFGTIIGDYWRFNKVISTPENVIILNITLVEEHVSAFNTIFGIDIGGVNYFRL